MSNSCCGCLPAGRAVGRGRVSRRLAGKKLLSYKEDYYLFCCRRDWLPYRWAARLPRPQCCCIARCPAKCRSLAVLLGADLLPGDVGFVDDREAWRRPGRASGVDDLDRVLGVGRDVAGHFQSRSSRTSSKGRAMTARPPRIATGRCIRCGWVRSRSTTPSESSVPGSGQSASSARMRSAGSPGSRSRNPSSVFRSRGSLRYSMTSNSTPRSSRMPRAPRDLPQPGLWYSSRRSLMATILGTSPRSGRSGPRRQQVDPKQGYPTKAGPRFDSRTDR